MLEDRDKPLFLVLIVIACLLAANLVLSNNQFERLFWTDSICSDQGWYCLAYTWQTLIAGMFALGGAIMTVRVIRKQINASREDSQRTQMEAKEIVDGQIEVVLREIDKAWKFIEGVQKTDLHDSDIEEAIQCFDNENARFRIMLDENVTETVISMMSPKDRFACNQLCSAIRNTLGPTPGTAIENDTEGNEFEVDFPAREKLNIPIFRFRSLWAEAVRYAPEFGEIFNKRAGYNKHVDLSKMMNSMYYNGFGRHLRN